MRNIKFDFIKGVACICVVFQHINFPETFGTIIDHLCNFAVPIFLMISGYYSFQIKPVVIKKRLKKLSFIFICAYALFFAYHFAFAFKEHCVGMWLSENFTILTPIKFIVFCTVDFAIPLWYLIAIIETYLLWYLIIQNNKQSIFLRVLPLLFLLQILLTSYCETVGSEWFWKINFFTRALPWFLLGYWLNTERASHIRNQNNILLIMFIVFGISIVLLKYFIQTPVDISVVGYIPYCLGIFILCLKEPTSSTCKLLEFVGKELSLYVYIFHVVVGGGSDIPLQNTFGNKYNRNRLLMD